MDAIIMQISGINGQSVTPGYENQIDILTYSHGLAMQIVGEASNPERTGGKAHHQDFTVTKNLDVATPQLNAACCEGRVIDQVTILAGHTEEGKVLPIIQYVLRNVVISSVSISGGKTSLAMEVVTLNYTHISWEFTSPGGPVRAKWDLISNTMA